MLEVFQQSAVVVGASGLFAGAIVIGMNVVFGDELGRSMAGLLGFVGRSLTGSAGAGGGVLSACFASASGLKRVSA